MIIQQSKHEETVRHCYALCVGIGTYSNLRNRDLRYAVADATVIADRLADPQRGNFAVTVLNEPTQTTKKMLDEAVIQMLSASDRRTEDLALLYFSCHGDINPIDSAFCLLPSNASLQTDGQYDSTTLIGITDFARWFANATIQNIVVLLDVCHSGGAGKAIQHFEVPLDAGPNIFFIGGARLDQAARQSSQFQHGLFTHCLLRAFEQPPIADGWLTVSQIHTFMSDELSWFTREHPTQVQSWSVSVNPNLPLVRNPGYPELAPLPPIWNIPLQRNVFFTGQEELLSQLASMLQGTQKTALTQPNALSGLGGIGKTQLATEYAYRHRQDYHAVLWGRAESKDALISSFLEIAQILDLPQKNEPDQTVIVEAVKTWLSHRPHWLFILDNADDLGLVQEFLPPTFRGHLLLTTRAQAMGKIVEGKLEVEPMQPEMGALLLLRRARIISKETTLEQTPSEAVIQAKGLAEELGGLPLALDQAGAYLEETATDLAEYWKIYQEYRLALLQKRGGLVDDHPLPVATTWSLSFQRVKERNLAAAQLLDLCAFFAPDAIAEEILTAGTSALGPVLAPVAGDTFLLNQAIEVLRAYSLIKRDPKEKTLSVHRLVQAVLQDSMEESERHTWAERAIAAINAAFPHAEHETWTQCERLLPHALLATDRIKQEQINNLEAGRLLFETASYLQDRARYVEAELLYLHALSIREQRLGPEHLDVADSLNNLAILYFDQGKYVKAEPLYQRALRIREQQLGPEHPDVAHSLDNLAEFYREQGKYAKAEPLYQQALRIRERRLGPEHPDVAYSLNNSAILYSQQGKYAEAEPLYLRALSIRERQLGPEHPLLASPLNNLAIIYKEQGKYAEAEPLHLHALRIREGQLGPEHPQVATSLHNLANLYQEQGKYAEAEPLYLRALQIWEQQLGLEHPLVANTLNHLATLYMELGRYAEAEPLYQRALHIQERQLGSMHPDMAETMHSLARFREMQGNSEEARTWYAQALVIREQGLGEMHPDTAETLHDLAMFEERQGNHQEALALYQRALTIRKQVFGSEHPSTKKTRLRLTSLLQSLSQETIALFQDDIHPE